MNVRYVCWPHALDALGWGGDGRGVAVSRGGGEAGRSIMRAS